MGGSRVVAGAAASCGVLNIQNQEFAENDRVAPLMICVRSSFDSGAACVRLAGMRSEFLVCLSGAQTFPIVLNKKNFTEINFHEALRTWTFLSGFHMPLL